MTKRVAFIGTDGGVSFSASGFDQALLDIGENTGNSIFQYALWRRISNPKFVVDRKMSAAEVRERADVVVFPAANQVNPEFDLAGWGKFIEEIDRPVVMIGLGAQAPIGSEPDLPLHEGTIRFLKAVAERTTQIGVRGRFTQEVLARHGVSNTVITGCPSQTINPNISGERINFHIARVKKMEQPRVAYVMGTMEPETRETEKALSAAFKHLDHSIIYQTDPVILRFLFNRTLSDEAREYLSWIGQILRPDLSAEEYISYVGWRGRFYSDARSWIDAMARFDVVTGLRIHGAIAGVQAGRLGICIAFDSRTLELAETMAFPFVRAAEITEGATIHSVVDKVEFDADRFDGLRDERSAHIIRLLTDGGCILY